VRKPGPWQHPAGGGIVPHHPISHARHGKPAPKKPPPPGKAHKKPAPAKKPKKPVPKKPHRKWSPGYDVACCSAEALGFLLGWGWDDVLALYWRTASDPDSGATIEATLEAGLTGVGAWRRLVLKPQPGAVPLRCSLTGVLHHPACRLASTFRESALIPGCGLPPAPLILGVTLPEPHAIAVTPDGTWWSWGEPFNPQAWPELVIEEAWCLP